MSHEDPSTVEVEAASDYRRAELEYLALGWPPVLAKAAMDPFDYAIGLRTGVILFFESAHQLEGAPDWVDLRNVRGHSVRAIGRADPQAWTPGIPFSFDRGIQVRVADIIWVADAPYGS